MAAEASDGEDRISALPDDALHHILSFLPSDDAVKTCVLARRWRHLWRTTRSLRLTPRPHRHRHWTASTLINFVNHFLLFRGAVVTVNECDILCGELWGDSKEQDSDLRRAICLWIRHAVANLQARVLRVCFKSRQRLCLDSAGVPLVSPHLTKVELTEVTIMNSSKGIDFSRCQALEDLTMSGCKIYSKRISSASLAHLTIVHCYFLGKTRARISTPRLVSLRLSVSEGRAPLLEKMPLLVAASATLKGLCYDTCEHNVCKHDGFDYDSSYGSDDDSRDSCYCIDEDGGGVYLENVASCDSCYGADDGSSVLLQGLSEATDLRLISDPLVFVLRKDCNSRTTLFSKLRNLLLNEWCLAVDYSALIYILQCSPVLEKLTLQLGHCETRYPVTKTDEGYNPKEQLFLVSKQLKMVEIRCAKKNKLVEKLLLLLMANGVPSEHIQIKPEFYQDLTCYSTDDSDYSDGSSMS